MWKFMARHELLLSILVLCFSLGWIILVFGKYTGWFLIFPLGISWLGLSLLLDFLERRYFTRTIMPNIVSRKRKLFTIMVVSLLFCILLDGFGVFVTKLWYYNFWSLKVYLTLTPFGYVAYSILLYLLYEFSRDVLIRYRKKERKIFLKEKTYRKVMESELIIGVIGYLFCIGTVTNNNATRVADFYAFFIVMISTFFIFEFICFKQNKQKL